MDCNKVNDAIDRAKKKLDLAFDRFGSADSLNSRGALSQASQWIELAADMQSTDVRVASDAEDVYDVLVADSGGTGA